MNATTDEFTARPRLSRFLSRPSNLALIFFVVSAGVLMIAWSGTSLLIRYSSFIPSVDRLTLPPVFAVSTLLMATGSALLHGAVQYVRQERQRPFRLCLIAAVIAGTAFVMTQCCGLWCLLASHHASSERNGIRDSAFVFAIMHGVHFVVALLFVVLVSLRAAADCYDHEYSRGVVFCAWFWHALGVLWLVILGAFGIAAAWLALPADLPALDEL